ncbi:phosphatase PAP2 family protein [Streptomyces chartreusis]|uniref:phosphatase PAP2 family protein n=1 Tax=Streptomyces chartreusis TaxID=1969 RepID=UPI0036FB55CC
MNPAAHAPADIPPPHQSMQPDPGAPDRQTETETEPSKFRLEATAVALTAGIYLALLGLTVLRAAPGPEGAVFTGQSLRLRWEALMQGGTAVVNGALQALTWVGNYGHWPLIVLTLYWLARRHQRIYMRTGVALLLSGTVGLLAFAAAPTVGLRPAEGGLIEVVTQQAGSHGDPQGMALQYLAASSLHGSWYLLAALALAAAAPKGWMRNLAAGLALLVDIALILTGDSRLLGTALGVVVPLLAWYTSGRLRVGSRPAAPRTADEVITAADSALSEPPASSMAPEPPPGPVPLRPAPAPLAAAPLPLRRAS